MFGLTFGVAQIDQKFWEFRLELHDHLKAKYGPEHQWSKIHDDLP